MMIPWDWGNWFFVLSCSGVVCVLRRMLEMQSQSDGGMEGDRSSENPTSVTWLESFGSLKTSAARECSRPTEPALDA
jgi:hypothetical protein